jgi:antitoxin HicB
MSDLAHYLNLHYTMVLREEDDGVIVASIAELPGCRAHGATATEALENLREMQIAWLDEAIKSGLQVPEPDSEKSHSGKWVQRVPKTLHRRLADMAKDEGTSLNQLVLGMLAMVALRRSEQSSDHPRLPSRPPG